MSFEEVLSLVVEWVSTNGEILASAGFQLAYKQVIADIVVNCTFIVLSIPLFFISVKYLKRLWAKTKEDDFEAIYGIVGVAIPVLNLLFCLGDTIRMIVNPYWYAIEKIVDLVK